MSLRERIFAGAALPLWGLLAAAIVAGGALARGATTGAAAGAEPGQPAAPPGAANAGAAPAAPEAPPGPVPAHPKGGVVLVTVDSLRADHLGCYGGDAHETPGFDALAKSGVRFTRAYAASPSTMPSTASLLTGLLPRRTGIRDDLGGQIEKDAPTLAERLRKAGFATAGVVGTFHLDSDHGFQRGFDHFDDTMTGIRKMIVLTSKERRAGEVVQAGLAALDALPADRPAFLWLNLHDPHYDYEAPEPQKSQFAADPYDGEVAYTDAQIAVLADGLRQRDPDGRFTLIVAGSHGEGLGDHQEVGHGAYLYETTIRVPLIIVPAGGDARRGITVDQPVSLVDLAPTVLDLAGLHATGLDGMSLVPLLRGADEHKTGGRAAGAHVSAGRTAGDAAAGKRSKGAADPPPAVAGDRRIFVEALQPYRAYGWSSLYALIQGDHKIVQGRRLEAFDLAADPGENAPLDPTPKWAADLAGDGPALLGPLRPPDDRRKEILSAADSLDLPWADSPFCIERIDRPDPRDPERVATNENLFVMRVESEQGIAGRAAKRAVAVLEDDPANLTALDMEVVLGLRNHWGDMLLDPLELLQCDYPFQGIGYHYYGHYLVRERKHEQALKVFSVFALVEPWAEEGEYDVACELAALGRKDEAFDHLRKAVTLGAHDFDFMRRDPRLAALRGDPRLDEILGNKGH